MSQKHKNPVLTVLTVLTYSIKDNYIKKKLGSVRKC